MLINFSNHSCNQWSEKQKTTAKLLYGDVVDIAFPFIDPKLSTEEVKYLSVEYFDNIIEILKNNNTGLKQNTVLIQGEFIFVFHLVTLLKKANVKCVASTSERDIQQVGNKKIINFNFIKFREY